MGDEQSELDSVLDLCCGGKKCPILRVIPGGFEITEDDARVEITREQARRVADWLARRLATGE